MKLGNPFRRQSEPETPTYEQGFKDAVEQSHSAPASNATFTLEQIERPYATIAQIKVGGRKDRCLAGTGGEPIEGTFTGYRHQRFEFGHPLRITQRHGVHSASWNPSEWRKLKYQVRHYATNPRLTFEKLTFNWQVRCRWRQQTRDARIFV